MTKDKKPRHSSNRLTTEDFVNKAKAIHGDIYNYSKVDYTRSHDKVVVICKIHKDFKITANNHLNGKGCPKCGEIRRRKSKTSNTSEFILKAVAIHGDKYLYERTVYTKAREKLIITCKKHGDFLITANGHLDGRGCIECGKSRAARSRAKRLDTFIKQSKAINKDRYSYEKAVYASTHTHIILTCKIHGDFKVEPNSHLRGASCSKCSYLFNGYTRTDFINRCNNKNKGVGKLYVIKCYRKDEKFYKIGISSTSVRKRFSGRSKMPYSYKLIREVNGSPDFIYNLENNMLRDLVKYDYEPKIDFKGKTECFSDLKAVLKCLDKWLNDEGEQ